MATPDETTTSERTSAFERSVRRIRRYRHDYLRWLYRGGRPNGFARLQNRASAVVFAAGIWPSRLATLEVPGRRSGRIISFPVVIADLDGQRCRSPVEPLAGCLEVIVCAGRLWRQGHRSQIWRAVPRQTAHPRLSGGLCRARGPGRTLVP